MDKPNETKVTADFSGAWLALNMTPVQLQALYLTLLRRERPAFGWMEGPLVAIEAALKPAHNAIHDRTFNAMNRQFFGDDRFKLEESPMPTAVSTGNVVEHKGRRLVGYGECKCILTQYGDGTCQPIFED